MKVWITYSHEDKEFVERLQNFLQKENFELLNIEDQLLPGDNIIESIYKLISQADVIFVIASKRSNASKWFSTEVGLIMSEMENQTNKLIIPILKDKGTEVPVYFEQYKYLDLSDGKDIDLRLNELIKAIKARGEPKHSLTIMALEKLEKQAVNKQTEFLKKEKFLYELNVRLKQKSLMIAIFSALIGIIFGALVIYLLDFLKK